MTMTLENFTRVPVADVLVPPSGLVQVYKDHWWVITLEDEVLLYKGKSPQCNKNKTIVERWLPPGCHAKFMAVAFVPIKLSDYT